MVRLAYGIQVCSAKTYWMSGHVIKGKKEHCFHYHNGHNCGICSAVCPYELKVLKRALNSNVVSVNV